MSSLRLLPPTRSECTSRRLHFSSKHLQRHFPLSLSHQFISCCCVKDRRLGREMLFCLLILEKVTFRQFAQLSHVAELSHHFSATQFTVPRTEAISHEEEGGKMPFYSPKPLQLHLKALLEERDPSTVVIEMIAMLFFDTIMGQRVKESSSNTDNGEQSSPNSNNEENGKTAELRPMAIRDISLHCNCSVISAKGRARS